MARKRLQYPSVSRVVNVPVPYPVVLGSDFADFELPVKSKFLQVGFTNVIFPIVAAVVQPYVFTSFSQPQLTKSVQSKAFDGWTVVPQIQLSIFSSFSQPQAVRSQQQQSLFIGDLGPAQTPPWFVFSDFGLSTQSRHPLQDQWIQFEVLPPAPVVSVVTFTGFSDFGIPSSNRFQQPDISGTLQPQVVTVVQPYVFSSFEQPQFRRIQVDYPVQFNQQIIQNYVFSQFDQPQFKRLILDQPVQFNLPVFVQPYVFSNFDQPRFKLISQDLPIQFVSLPIVIITPPVFTGFNDFGLAQQTVGTQQKQDGQYTQFTVLPMPQVISPFFFTGFSDFATMLLTKQTGLIGLGSDQPNVVLQPIIPLFPEFATGGGKRWQYDPRQTKNFEGVSSNLSEATYETDDKRLVIKFKTYEYENVDPSKAQGLFKAKSPGKFFHSNIKGKHPTNRIK